MKTQKNVLGKGLGALIRESAQILKTSNEELETNVESQEIVTKIPVELIDPNPYQPRVEFDENSLIELKNSIIEKGIIQPITVRRLEEGRYQLISGERRLRAAKLANLDLIPAYILKVETKEEMIELSLIENIQRDTLNPIEIAYGFKRLMEECNMTYDEIAKKTSKDRTTIANFIRLLKLPDEIQQSLIKNELTIGHARAIINIDNLDDQLELWKKIIADKSTVREVEKLAKEKKRKQKFVTANIQLEPNLEAVVSSLREIFGTKVRVKQRNDGSGEINIEFYSREDFERIIEVLNAVKTANYH